MVALVVVALLLMWRVYAHHRGTDSDENAVVELSMANFGTTLS